MKRKVLCIALALLLCMTVTLPTFADGEAETPLDRAGVTASFGLKNISGSTYKMWARIVNPMEVPVSATLTLYNASYSPVASVSTKRGLPRQAPFLSLLVETVLGLELFDAAAPGHVLLLACKERMTRRANVQPDLRLRGHRRKCVSACASNFTFHVFRMDSFLHASHLFLFGPSQKSRLFRICRLQRQRTQYITGNGSLQAFSAVCKGQAGNVY